MAIISKYVAVLSQQLQCIILHIQQNSVHILCKPGPALYIADWLSRNSHMENKEQKITGMSVNAHATSTAVDILTCTSIEDTQAGTRQDADL